MSEPLSTAPAGPASADAPPDSATIPVARSAWMPPRFFLLFGLTGVALHLRHESLNDRVLVHSAPRARSTLN